MDCRLRKIATKAKMLVYFDNNPKLDKITELDWNINMILSSTSSFSFLTYLLTFLNNIQILQISKKIKFSLLYECRIQSILCT